MSANENVCENLPKQALIFFIEVFSTPCERASEKKENQYCVSDRK